MTTPALLTSASSPPRRSASESTACRVDASSRSSHVAISAPPPAARISPAMLSRRSRSRATRPTASPVRPRTRAMPAPIPRLAPVMMTRMDHSVDRHSGQPLRRWIRASRNVMSRRSKERRRPARRSPKPETSLIASIAARQPTVPETAPKTGKRRLHAGGSSMEAAEARGLSRKKRRDARFELVHRAFDHRLLLPLTLAIEQEALAEERRAVDDDVRESDQGSGVLFSDVLWDRLDPEARIELAKTPCGARDARGPESVVGHEELAVEVARLHIACVREDQSADSGCRELVRNDAAESPDSGDEHGRALETLLTSLSVPRHVELPLVGRAFLGSQRPRFDHPSSPPAIGGGASLSRRRRDVLGSQAKAVRRRPRPRDSLAARRSRRPLVSGRTRRVSTRDGGGARPRSVLDRARSSPRSSRRLV